MKSASARLVVWAVAIGCAVGSVSVAAAATPPPPFYQTVDLGVLPGGSSSQALAVNADGTVVVGWSRVGSKTLPFIWRNGVMENIGDPASMVHGYARSVTGSVNNFRVVGEYTDVASKRKHGFVYSSAGAFQDLPMLDGHEQSTAWSINADGKIAGYTYFDRGPSVFSPYRKQAVPVRWDPVDASPGVSYVPPKMLYDGPLLDWVATQCKYTGKGFNMGLPIRLNDLPIPTIVTSWNVPTPTGCASLGTKIQILNYLAYRPIKHTADDSDISPSSWKGPGAPSFTAYQDYYPNQNNFKYADTYGDAINNVGTEIHHDVAPLYQPGFSGTAITSFTWSEINGVSSYTAATGVSNCSGRGLQYTDINDSDEIIGYTSVTNTGYPCTLTPKGFIRPLGGSLRYLLDRVNQICGWTRLVPTDINNDGYVVGGGARANGAHAVLLIPVDSLPATQEEACIEAGQAVVEISSNNPPLADAGADQIVEATSQNGADVTLNGTASSDPDGDTLTYTWTTPLGSADGASPVLTLPLGTHTITLTVEDAVGETATDTVTITVQDTTPPETALTAQPAAISNVASPSFAYAGTDIVTPPEAMLFECALDGAPLAPCANPLTYVNLPDGTHEFQVRAVDEAGNADATPVQYTWLVDATPPAVVIDSPAQAAEFILGSAQTASYSCSDSGSGINACTGTLPNGATIDTGTLGAYNFTVNATDVAGNHTDVTRAYTVSYGVCGYEQSGGGNAGSVIPVKLFMCDANGSNLSAENIVVTATGVVRVSDGASVPLATTGNGGFNFQYQSGAGRYKFNLNTDISFVAGIYSLKFTVSGDPTTHHVEFQIR